ncbi:MAG: ATP-dependent DNA helicase RecG, partial [Patescibacteria group bacterium]
ESALLPIYPESRGITSRFLYHAIKKILGSNAFNDVEELVPEEILKKYNLPVVKTALIWIHAPREEKESISARKRFAFEKVFLIQLAEQKKRLKYESKNTFVVEKNKDGVDEFLKRFPFEPTNAQIRALEIIFKDLGSGKPMMRLLEGDVGSGKTLVAATASYLLVTTRPLKHQEEGVFGRPSLSSDGLAKRQNFGNLQVAYMAPTEILAKQHFESFINYFSHLPIQIGLMTSSGCKKFPSKVNPNGATDISRTQLLKWVGEGVIPILIGTHALIQKSVSFKHLALAIIDEQHRFGTTQRALLAQKDSRDKPVPHLLSMTATPIPRTLALTIYGSLDLTLLDEMPKGRKEIITEIVLPGKREEVYEKVRQELKVGRQAYVICPRINEPDPNKELALLAKSVKTEAARLKKEVFPEYSIAILHSKMKGSDKDATMQKFTKRTIDILVATSMVEVGVNVENATVIIIEGAERFGLAQLHQLRGRVLRSTHQAYCYLFSDTRSKNSFERLRAIKKARNGFELAEIDLTLRGSGELGGGKQWGLSDLAMEAIKNLKMVEAARAEAMELLKKDPELKNYPLLQNALGDKKTTIHLE